MSVKHLLPTRSQHGLWVGLVLLTSLSAGCEREPHADAEGPYVPPEPAQLTPPSSVVPIEGVSTVTFHAGEEAVEAAVAGSLYRPIRAMRVDEEGRRRLEIFTSDEGDTVTFAEADFHLLPTGATSDDGTIMLCWNTLTGESSEFSPDAPDPARGMALHCRTNDEGALGPVARIRAPTVGTWIRRLVALPGGEFRLLYKGDDGWFEAGDDPAHGVYEAYYRDGEWTSPTLLIPIPSPSTP